MITLFSGLPGNGKTLFALWYLVKKAKAENREVFYNNVKGLDSEKVGNWQEFDPQKWFELPHGAMILMDECQDTFGKKPNGAALPAVYSELNTHRHRGYDIFLITQHPTLLDNSVRRLIGQHFHTVRKFGLERATVYEWSACNPSPESASSQKSAVSLKWAFPKEVYSWYKSAEVHTVKKAIPMKLVLAILFVIAVPCVGYYALTKYQSRGKSEVVPSAIASGVPVSSVAPGLAPGVAPGVRAPVDPVADAKEYMFNQTPRVAGLAHTAPRYDQITQAVRAPVPAACIQIGSTKSSTNIRCSCYSQQGTKMDVEFNMCIQIAQNGWFRDFDADGRGASPQQSQPVVAHAAEPSSVSVESRPAVVAFNEASPSLVSSVPPPAPEASGRASSRPIRRAVPRE